MNNDVKIYEDLLQYLNMHNGDVTVPKIKKDNVLEITDKPKIEDFSDIKPVSFQKFNLDNTQQDSKGFSIKQFENMMRLKLIEEYKIQQSYERPYVSVGELLNCLRQNYYSRMKYQVDVNELFNFPYLYLINEVGKHIHVIFQQIYNFSETEKSMVSEKYKVKGRADAIKENTLFDIKTIESKNDLTENKKKKSFNQANIYTFILNTEYGYKIDNITIIYVLRNLKNIYPFDFKPNEKLARSLVSRAKILLDHIEKHIVPDPFGVEEEHCKYCIYKKYCVKDSYREIKPPFLTEEEKNKKEEKVAFLL